MRFVPCVLIAALADCDAPLLFCLGENAEVKVGEFLHQCVV